MFPGLPVDVPGFWIDRHEVTNRQFKEFVDAGGYQRSEYWKHPFLKNGQRAVVGTGHGRVPRRLGKPGPATWELGSYPEGKADYPVGGVSWYEAAAYAEYAGKSLPTVHHWLQPRGWDGRRFSRCSSSATSTEPGPAPVESIAVSAPSAPTTWRET